CIDIPHTATITRHLVSLHWRRKCRKHHLRCLILGQIRWTSTSRELASEEKGSETGFMGPGLTGTAAHTPHQRVRLFPRGRPPRLGEKHTQAPIPHHSPLQTRASRFAAIIPLKSQMPAIGGKGEERDSYPSRLEA